MVYIDYIISKCCLQTLPTLCDMTLYNYYFRAAGSKLIGLSWLGQCVCDPSSPG